MLLRRACVRFVVLATFLAATFFAAFLAAALPALVYGYFLPPTIGIGFLLTVGPHPPSATVDRYCYCYIQGSIVLKKHGLKPFTLRIVTQL